ncbi:MAG TPA: ParB/RepB/Spo0J family partition protein [Armatimonadota bacterium]|nr:ParB/RepB/Spo0J family partition protein [Armatimonadota bacterium]
MGIFRRNRSTDRAPQPVEVLSVIDVSSIRLNPRQPRRSLDEQKLDELADSIREHGVIEPVIVRPSGDGAFELVAGERRFRAAVHAGLQSIPAVARVLNDRQSLELALVENLQREDIKPLECAQAYRRLMDEFGLTQEQVAQRVGKDRSTVANTLRLLNLPLPILESLDTGEITEGHARALLSIPDQDEQLLVWKKVVMHGLSVRAAERLSRTPRASGTSMTPHVSRATRRRGRMDPNLADVEDKLRRYLGTKVAITRLDGGKGKIEIEFYDDDDLMRILDLMSHM